MSYIVFGLSVFVLDWLMIFLENFFNTYKGKFDKIYNSIAKNPLKMLNNSIKSVAKKQTKITEKSFKKK